MDGRAGASGASDSESETQVSDAEVRAELSAVLGSHGFANAPSLRRFLAHVVEHTLDGRTADLKEYSLGVDVFDRGEHFDPKLDTIVRVQARRLRAKLRDYYADEGKTDRVRIELAKWHYVPEFTRAHPSRFPYSGRQVPREVVQFERPSDQAAPAGSRRRRLMFAVTAVVAVLLALSVMVGRRHVTARAGLVTVPSEYTQLTDFSDSATAPAVSPDGRLVAFIRGGEAFLSHGQIYVKVLPNGEAVRLTNGQNRKFAPAFTPDGSRVSYSETRLNGSDASWETFTVPVFGGQPSLLLSNATGLAWLDAQHVIFSAFKHAGRLGVVASTPSRAEEREIYFPSHERGMAHYAYPSPDRRSVLIVEMDGAGTFRACRLVPFDGRSPGRAVGPEGSCRSAAWSPDGKWMYFGVAVAGHAHLWRQAYPDGAPEQITFGPTEEEGVAVAPDGRSLITSIGHRQSAIWIHDASGDRPLASESFAYAPRLSRDSRRVYFLQRESPDASTSELRRIDLASGKVERLLAGLPFALDDDVIGRDYDISRDERDVVFAARDRNGRPTIWLARLDGGVAPRAIVAGGHYVSFGERDEIFFVTLDKETSYLTRTDRDGVRRERIGSISPVFSRGGMSPDGEWIVVFGRSPDNVDGPATYAVPIRGGAPQRICTGMCWGGWSGDGRTFYVNVYDESTPEQTIAIPLPGGTTVPDVPPLGLNQSTNQLTIPGVRIINRWAVPLGDPSTYVYAKSELLRNLYRVPLH